MMKQRTSIFSLLLGIPPKENGHFSTHSNSLKKGNGIGNMPTLTKKEKKNGHLFIIFI